MANLGVFTFDTSKKYKNLSEITGLTFSVGTKYLLQVQSTEPFYFCVSTSGTPKKGGFKCGLDPFTYRPSTNSELYVCTYGKITLNIAEN